MNFRKHFSLVKVDEKTHRVFGPVMSEAIDSDNEIADFEQHKSAYDAWSKKALEKTTAAGQEPSLGNIRIQHDHLKIGGKATKVVPDEQSKGMNLESEPVNDEVWHMLQGGFLTGYSQAGTYLWRKCNTCSSEMPRKVGANYCANCRKDVTVRYGSELHEVSYVDVPANPDATFSYVRSDGVTEMRKFARIGAPDDIATLVKTLRSDLSFELDTQLEKFSQIVADLLDHTATGEHKMKPEQIAACAKALNITVEEFTKQYLESGPLAKGHKGLAALGAHLKKASAHHAKMAAHHAKIAEMHKAHGEMHSAMAEHMENCMKAHDACTDGEEKTFKEVKEFAEGETIVKKDDAPPDVTKAIAEAVATQKKEFEAALEKQKKEFDAALEKSVAPIGGGVVRMALIDRDGKVLEKSGAKDSDPLPV